MTRTLTLIEAARMVGGEALGEETREFDGIAPVDEARPSQMGFLASRRYLERSGSSQAGALLVSEAMVLDVAPGRDRLVVEDPYLALKILLDHFYPPAEEAPSVHPTAVLGRGARLGRACRIGPYVVIGDGAVLGDGVRIDAHCCIGDGCRIGEGTRLFPHVVLYDGTLLGRNVTVHAGAKIGVDGFGYVYDEGAHRKIPQVGDCVLGDDVEVGANTTIDRGSIGTTRVEEGSKLDNLVHLAHNVRVGPKCLIAAQAGVAGSTRVGPGAVLGGQAGLTGHIEVGAGARIGAQAGVIGDVEPGKTVIGFPARDRIEFLRGQAALARLPSVLKRLRPVGDGAGE